MKITTGNRERLFEILQKQEDSKKQLLEAIRGELVAGEIPAPDVVREAIAKLFVTDAIDILRAHRGFDLEDKIRSIRTVLQLFDQTFIDLKRSLDNFDTFSQRPEFGYRSYKEELTAIESRVRKETFAFSELAHTLQDHCRRLSTRWSHPEKDSRIQHCFGTDGLHDFLCGLRTALHHRSMVEADWLIRNVGRLATTHFIFDRRELMAAGADWNKRAQAYLATCSNEIDVRAVADTYHGRVHAFYDWLLSETDASPPPDLADYRRCWNAHQVHNVRMVWRLLLTQFLDRAVDPYPYLDRYLSPTEMEAALRFPPHSREQADFIIRAVDDFKACDAEIVSLVYRLFAVPEQTG